MPSSLVDECFCLAALSYGPTDRRCDGLACVNTGNVALVRRADIRVALRLCAFGRHGGGMYGTLLGVMTVLLGAEDVGEQRFHTGLGNLDMRQGPVDALN